jgi:hypothetical protein
VKKLVIANLDQSGLTTWKILRNVVFVRSGIDAPR